MCRVKIRMGGKLFETWQKTLENIPYFLNLFQSPTFKPDEEILIDGDPEFFSSFLKSLEDKNIQFSKERQKEIESFYYTDPDKNDPESTLIKGKISTLEFVAINEQTDVCHQRQKSDQFLSKKPMIREVMIDPEDYSSMYWKDDSNVFVGSRLAHFGQNLLLYFTANENESKTMKTHKDYFDLIDEINIYMFDRTKSDFLNSIKNGELMFYEKSTGEEMYVRFLNSKHLKKNKNFGFPSIIPIFVADEKISTKYTEHQPFIIFNEDFVVHIKFNQKYKSKIENLKVRSYGYITEHSVNFYASTIFRWVKYKYISDIPIKTGQLDVKEVFPAAYSRYIIVPPIKTLFVQLKITNLESDQTNYVKFIELKLLKTAARLLSGRDYIYKYFDECNSTLVLWYKMEFQFYLFPRRIDTNSLHIEFSDDITSENKVTVGCYFYEVLNFDLNFYEPTCSEYELLYHTPTFSDQSRKWYMEEHSLEKDPRSKYWFHGDEHYCKTSKKTCEREYLDELHYNKQSKLSYPRTYHYNFQNGGVD